MGEFKTRADSSAALEVCGVARLILSNWESWPDSPTGASRKKTRGRCWRAVGVEKNIWGRGKPVNFCVNNVRKMSFT